MIEWISDKAVSRTAPATPGVLKIRHTEDTESFDAADSITDTKVEVDLL